MRAYKFLTQQYGLKSLYERRLRRTRINELNDPFELRPYDLTDSRLRWAFEKTRSEMAERFGLLCFSADWCDPLIWAHYSDQHKGLCLGFDIPPEAEQPRTRKVDYISAPLAFPADLQALQNSIAEKMIFTKYHNWDYEHEVRTWTDLEEEFFEFCTELKLVEVIIGAQSPLPSMEILRALGAMADHVMVKKARAADDRFSMIADEEFVQPYINPLLRR
jgi:hypothetical protein